MIRIALAGAGAIGLRHLDAFAAMPKRDAAVVCLIEPESERARQAALRFGIADVAANLDAALKRRDIDAVVLCTPTPLHASQAAACLRAGKHVLIEIPMADSVDDADMLVRLQRETGLVAMACHTRRFNHGHQWLHRRLRAGRSKLQHLVAHTWFLRRANLNALGQPRSWTDHLLWHHACHTVDLFQHQTGQPALRAQAMQGPPHPKLGIAMDMSVQLASPRGVLCTLALSFNNDGPFGSAFRYLCDDGTWVARDDALVDGHDNAVDLGELADAGSGIALQDAEFIAAIREKREASASVAQVMPAYLTLERLRESLARTL
jgi:2-hydroxy-4-carboxymuconate semialdehyde hemiacetal dehydrogenase